MELQESEPELAALKNVRSNTTPPGPGVKLMEEEATSYLRQHKIPELLQNLTAALVFHRPEDPKAFMREHIRRLQKAKSDHTQSLPLFIDDSNVRSVFGMLDLTGRGHVTLHQYEEAMKSFGVPDFNREPSGAELNRIHRDTFVREANFALKRAAATFFDQ